MVSQVRCGAGRLRGPAPSRCVANPGPSGPDNSPQSGGQDLPAVPALGRLWVNPPPGVGSLASNDAPANGWEMAQPEPR